MPTLCPVRRRAGFISMPWRRFISRRVARRLVLSPPQHEQLDHLWEQLLQQRRATEPGEGFGYRLERLLRETPFDRDAAMELLAQHLRTIERQGSRTIEALEQFHTQLSEAQRLRLVELWQRHGHY